MHISWKFQLKIPSGFWEIVANVSWSRCFLLKFGSFLAIYRTINKYLSKFSRCWYDLANTYMEIDVNGAKF